jgi:LysM repeat protein
MKHLIIVAIAVTVAIGAYAQEIMKPIVPKNTLQLYLDKAKVYSEAAAAEQKERIDELIQKINSLTARIKVVEATYQQKDGTVGIIAEPGQAVAVNDAAADAYISGQMDQPATLLAKSVSIDNTQISITNMPSSGAGVLITSPTIDVVGSKLSGNTQKSSNLVMAQGTETMTVKDTTFTGQTYNTIMTGQRTTEYLKEFTVQANLEKKRAEAPPAKYHTVKKGDTLGAIARKYGRTVKQLMSWNGITNPDAIREGQKLRVSPQ